jgi:hypothetical protein
LIVVTGGNVKRLVFVCALALLASPAWAQSKEWKKALDTGLETAYPSTRINNSTHQVKDPGIVLVVQKPGIATKDDVGSFIIVRSIVKDGELVRAAGATTPGHYALKAGDKVYVRKIDVTDTAVQFLVVTADTVESTLRGTTVAARYQGLVDFQFPKGYLETASMADVTKAVGVFLATAEQATAAKTVELGQTIAQVEGILGKPEAAAKLGTKTIYTYKSMKIIFIDGKVSDVQ